VLSFFVPPVEKGLWVYQVGRHTGGI